MTKIKRTQETKEIMNELKSIKKKYEKAKEETEGKTACLCQGWVHCCDVMIKFIEVMELNKSLGI